MSAIQIQAYPDPGQAAALWVDGSALEPEASLGGARSVSSGDSQAPASSEAVECKAGVSASLIAQWSCGCWTRIFTLQTALEPVRVLSSGLQFVVVSLG